MSADVGRWRDDRQHSVHRRLDAACLAADVEEFLAGRPATVVAFDAGVPPAFLLGLRRPDLVTRLVLIEGTRGTLPGADDFFAPGPPWWFGVHAVPGLAETLLAGNHYVGWFYDRGSHNRGVRPDVRAANGWATRDRARWDVRSASIVLPP